MFRIFPTLALTGHAAIPSADAFFVRSEYRDVFSDVPRNVSVLWSPPRYFQGQYGHPVSPTTVALIMNNIGKARVALSPRT